MRKALCVDDSLAEPWTRPGRGDPGQLASGLPSVVPQLASGRGVPGRVDSPRAACNGAGTASATSLEALSKEFPAEGAS
eukprot:352668-Chlamydomonas_euryale.AAC.1